MERQDDALYKDDFDKALDRLPAAQSKAFLLITRDGASYDDAAEHLGIRRGALASRVSPARAQLRAKCLGESRPTPPSAPGVRSEPLSDRAPSRYERWKASGARFIGRAQSADACGSG